MTDFWEINVKVKYQSKDRVVEAFEQIVSQFRGINYARCIGGNSATYYSIIGPKEPPLSESEITKLRSLIA